jgi:drug/metabolite transporter (DMT)-like permease
MSRGLPLPRPAYGHAARDWIQLHLVVLAWGFTAILGKLLTLPPVEVVIWRTALAAVGLAIFARMKGAKLQIPTGVILKLLGIGVLIGAHWMLFFLSVRLSNVSVCMAALPTTMLWCTIIEPFVERGRRISLLELGMGALMVGAVWLIFSVEFSHWAGFAAGLGAALTGALFAVLNKVLVSRQHYAVVSCYEMVGACAASLIALPFFAEGGGWLHWPTGSDFLCLLVLSQVCTVGAYAAYMDVLRRMSVFTINVAYNLEPVYGIVLGAIIFGDAEHMSGGFYIGAGIILVAVIALPLLQRARRKRRAGFGEMAGM